MILPAGSAETRQGSAPWPSRVDYLARSAGMSGLGFNLVTLMPGERQPTLPALEDLVTPENVNPTRVTPLPPAAPAPVLPEPTTPFGETPQPTPPPAEQGKQP